jgi:hypothetical protein
MHSPKECWFDHERLEVYQESIAFIAWLSTLLDETVRVGDVKDQRKSQVRIPRRPLRCTRAVVRVRRSA